MKRGGSMAKIKVFLLSSLTLLVGIFFVKEETSFKLPFFTPPKFLFFICLILQYFLLSYNIVIIINSDTEVKNYQKYLKLFFLSNFLSYLFFGIGYLFLWFSFLLICFILLLYIYQESSKIQEKSTKFLDFSVLFFLFMTCYSLTVYVLNTL